MNIAAVVVWYRPKPAFADNIMAYLSYVSEVIIVDNSDADNGFLVPGGERITYRPLHENLGIAAALNVGCRIAADRGYDMVMTMDQNSRFTNTAIATHLADAEEAMLDPSVAVIGPAIDPSVSVGGMVEKNGVITSGSIMRVSAWLWIGGFNEALFIDQVDHEFCFRLRRAGCRVLLNTAVSMSHQLGSPLSGSFFGIKVSSWNHDRIRKYYMMRNRLYMRFRFPEFRRPYFRRILSDVMGVLLLEEDKWAKLSAMMEGGGDFFAGRMGKWDAG